MICSQLFHRKKNRYNSNVSCSIRVGSNCKEPVCYSQFNWKVALLVCPLGGRTELLHTWKSIGAFPASLLGVASICQCGRPGQQHPRVHLRHILLPLTAAFREIPHLYIPVALSHYNSCDKWCFKILYSKLVTGLKKLLLPTFWACRVPSLPGKRMLCHQVKLPLSLSLVVNKD